MSTLSPDELAKLRTELAGPAYAGLTDAQRFDAIHRAGPSVADPAPRGEVPVVLAEMTLMGLLTDPVNGSAAKLMNWPNLGLLKADIDADNHVAVLAWAAELQIPGLITPGEAQAIAAYVGSTVPDPDWPVQVPGPTPKDRLFGGKSWTLDDGSVVDFVPLGDVIAAR